MVAEIEKYLECMECRSSLKKLTDDKILCVNCEKIIRLVDGVPRFVETPDDIFPTIKSNPDDKRNWSVWRKKNFDFISQTLAGTREDSLIVDLGAGQRPFRALFERFDQIAVDFYPYDGINMVCDVSERLPLKSEFSDCVVLSNMLEHMHSPEVTLSECYRILKPAGMIIITVPFIIKVHQAPHDFYRYTHFGLEHLLKRTGFSSVTISPIGDICDVILTFSKLLRGNIDQVEYPILRTGLKIMNKLRGFSEKYICHQVQKDMNSLGDLESPQGYHCVAIK